MTPIRWLPIYFYPEYMISNTGLVKVIKTGKCLKPRKRGGWSGDKYLAVDLRSRGHHKNKYVHRLVAEAFVPNPMLLPIVHHVDTMTSNNGAENLEWTDYDDCKRGGHH